MNPLELARLCADAINAQAGTGIPRAKAMISIVTPNDWRPLDGFPRGEVILVKPNGDAVRQVGAARVLSWMLAHGLADVAPREDQAL